MTQEIIDGEATEVDEDGNPVTPATGHEIVHREPAGEVAVRRELSVDELVAQVEKIHEIQRRVMKDGIHYGVVPGVEKPGLSKAGAELLNLTFWMAPRYRVTKTYDGDHLTVDVVAELYHRDTGNFLGEGVGLCTTKEKKYAYRTGSRQCPVCGKAAIIKGKEEYGGGWLCWARKDGCGAKFPDDSPDGIALAKVEVGQVPNEDLADTHNTVVKMAKKRALVDAVLTSTAAGDVFTQDVDDRGPSGEGSGNAAGDQPSDPSAATPDPEPSPEAPAEPPKPAAKSRVTRLRNLAKEAHGIDDARFDQIVSNHMAATGLEFLESAYVEEQIKMLERPAPDAAGAGAPAEEAA